jgi:hypothetical protein
MCGDDKDYGVKRVNSDEVIKSRDLNMTVIDTVDPAMELSSRLSAFHYTCPNYRKH